MKLMFEFLQKKFKKIEMFSFNVGDNVAVKLHDWNKDGMTKKIVPGKILAKINEPSGYDVELVEPVSFIGHIPFPRQSKNTSKITNDSALCKVIFVRDFCVSIQIKEKMLKFINGLVFKTVNVVMVKPDKFDYVNVYTPEGKIYTLADDRDISKYVGNDVEGRLAFKVPHFFGFTHADTQFAVPDYVTNINRDQTNAQSIHFSVNRISVPDFYQGTEWKKYDEYVFRPQSGQIICGKPSQIKNNKPQSFDYWFISSTQFMNFCKLLSSKCVPKQEQMTELLNYLVLPKNEKNFFIPHEPYISRYIYAAMYLILVTGTSKLPEEWELPKKAVKGVMQPFEEWWPKAFLACNI